jgi:beta-lactamase regulating signal transducer with metallopeptidase domain
MSAVLLQTLAWTGVLIAAVLVLRRPVTRHFGAQAAYALWALPAARLVIPPVVLPAWMAPREAAPAAPAALPAPDMAQWQAAAEAPATASALPSVPMETAPQVPSGFDLLAVLADWPLTEILLTVWLIGAAGFLALRFAAYFSLRDTLLAEGREVGRVAGLFGLKVRLVETPATHAPLAMGVLDPVIALPPGFLALHDRTGRDLALAHELAHHRGGDLLVNVLVQPLFALHWFNPLARYGWLALRRDQEAACDARVLAHRGAQDRAAYAALIARFAAAPGTAHHAALTAPMACPVLGEKSIIHRLRSLAMSDLSPRRRMAGRALLGAGLLALPLTASITYAAGESMLSAVPEVPEPPAPPAPPAPPSPPEAPDAPDAPEAPEVPEPPVVILMSRDGKGGAEVTEHVWRDADGKERRVKMVFRGAPDAEAMARRMESAEGADKAEHQAMLAELRGGLAEADRALADLPRVIAIANAEAMAAGGSMPRVIVKHGCGPDGEEVSDTTSRDGTQIIRICQRQIAASARKGLEEARAEIAGDKDIPEDTRKQILRTLDAQIARWSKTQG